MATSLEPKVDENGVVQQPVWKCPFIVRRIAPFVQEGENRMIPRITDQVKVDKETMTVSPVVETYDICQEVQTWKDQCGLEYFKLLLKQGKVSAEDARDDGSHSVDMRQIPQTIHDASKVAQAQSDVLSSLAKQLGLKDGESITADKLVDLVVAKVAANVAATQSNGTKEGDSK